MEEKVKSAAATQQHVQSYNVTQKTKPLYQTTRPTLRILGTEINALPEIQSRAASDLGIKIVFEKLDFEHAQRRSALDPQSYDIYDQCFHNLDIVWFWRAIQPIEISKIHRWNEISDLTKTGQISPNASIGRGDAPVTKLYVQTDNTLDSRPTTRISMLPTIHNFDSFVYRTDHCGNEPPTSWGALFDPHWHGRVALVDEPAIGIFDAILAAQASGAMKFHDIGQLDINEIDALTDLLVAKRNNGHFVDFWKTAAEAADWMINGTTWLQSLWSPSMTILQRQAIPVQQAVPIEGYRAWHGGLCLSSALSGRMRDVAYEYLNWWLDGYAGAVAARQGYYMSVPERVKYHLSHNEWCYWYEGAAASSPLTAPDGTTIVQTGETRSGGSYWQRCGSIAVWNTTMDEHNYLARRWARLIKPHYFNEAQSNNRNQSSERSL